VETHAGELKIIEWGGGKPKFCTLTGIASGTLSDYLSERNRLLGNVSGVATNKSSGNRPHLFQ
jgi:hypothetical protein